MTTVALSPKFQIVIPKAVRESLKLMAGQRLDIEVKNDKIVIAPQITIASLRGILPGMNTDVPNDPEWPEDPTWPGGCDPVYPEDIAKFQVKMKNGKRKK